MIRLLLALTLLLSASAFAAEGDDVCRLLPAHKASDDVAYKPGVDVNGKAVAPADLTPPVQVMPEKVTIPVTVDIARYMNLGADLPAGLEMNAGFGSMDVYPDGRVLYNGQDITDNANTACSGAKDEKPAQDKPIEDNGEISGEGH